MWNNRAPPLLAVLLIMIFITTAALSVREKSSSWDDPFHLTCGISQIQTGDPRMNADHPPLARIIGALPALFINIDSVAKSNPEAWEKADITQASVSMFDGIETRLLWFSRLTMLIFSIILGVLLYSWGRQLFGPTTALLPISLYAFCPPLLANAPLVTTDMAATTFIFASIYCWWRYLAQPSNNRLLWTCLAVSCAFATKYSAAVLIPLFVILSIVSVYAAPNTSCSLLSKLRVPVSGLLIIGITALAAINIIYLFDGSFLTPPEYMNRAIGQVPSVHQLGATRLSSFWPAWLPVPLPYYYVTGFLFVLNGVQNGFTSYFLGEAGYGGWPNYFTVILLVKLSIPILLLILVGAFRVAEQFPRGLANSMFVILPPLLIVTVASIGKMQIGIRHILPALPFLLLLTGYTLHCQITLLGKMAIGILVLLNGISSLQIHPDYLMYFNFLAGGPDQGWRISISGDDYGQGDADLEKWLQARNIKEVAYGEFGWGQHVLRQHGIRTKPVPCQDTGEMVAIHAGRLLFTRDLSSTLCYAWMHQRKPDEKIGYNIFLYNTNNIPRPSPPVNLDLFNQALELQLKGENAQSIPLYQQYLMQEPDYYQAHFNLACALKDTGRCETAVFEFERTLELWPGYKEAHLHLASCYHELGHPDKVRQHEEQYKQN